MKRLQDSRIHPWPRVTQDENKTVVSAKVLNPWRLQKVLSFIVHPLSILWKIGLLILIFDIGFATVKGFVFPMEDFGVNREKLYSTMAVSWLLFFIEKRSNYNLTRFLVGNRLRIVIKPDKLSVGGWIFRKRFRRDLAMSFSIQPIEQAKSEVYQASQQLMLVIDDSRSVKVGIIHTLWRAKQVVENANMAIRLSEAGSASDLDFDPSRSAGY